MMLAALVALLSPTLLAAAPPPEPAPLAELAPYVTRAMEDWKVPGVAIAVVKDGKVVLSRGFGVREAGKPGLVDDRTVFAIGSLTKGFTSAAVGLLVDSKQVGWDDPVTEHLPGFALADPYVTRELTLRDVLSHRTGVKEDAEALWYGTKYTRQDIMSRLRYLGQAEQLRTTVTYSNIMYLVAGELVAARSGMSWDRFVSKRLFEPLGMTSTGTHTVELAALGNVASPHVDRTGEARPIRWLDGGTVGPAASIHSNARDMARWLLMQLGQGTLEGKRVLSPEVVGELHTPQMLLRRDPLSRRIFPETHVEAHGMGWLVKDHRGRWMVWNTGGMDGMACSSAFLPEENLGVIVLTNGPRVSFPEALVYRVVDSYLGGPVKDWNKIRLDVSLEYRQKQKEAEKARESARIPGTKPSLPLERYAGTYSQPLLGELTLSTEKGRLRVGFAGWEGEAEPWHYDTFKVKWKNEELGTAMLTFSLGSDGIPAHVVVQGLGEFDRR